jgi:predicted transcriptional regulator
MLNQRIGGMDAGSDPVEQIAFLARSESRVRVLEALSEDGPANQRALRDCIDMSRSTLSRSLQALEEQGWVAESDGGYHLSPVGHVIAEEFLELLERISLTEDLAPFLRWFPYGASDLELIHLSDAEVIPGTNSDPIAPVRKHQEAMKSAHNIRLFIPSLDREASRAVHDGVMDGRLEAEIVVTPSVEETIGSGDFAELFRPQIETDRMTVLSIEDDFPRYYFGLVDDRVQVGVEDDEGIPRALLETTADPVWEWAEKRYETLRERATVKPIEDF